VADALDDPPRGLPELAARLAAALAGTLPGQAVHDRLSPRLTDGTLPVRAPQERPAAVLVLLFARDGIPHVVLTVRGAGLPHHADQISLPGGRPEPGESPEATALREAAEEIGLDPAGVTIAGRLTPVHIPVSGFTVQAIVGIAPGNPAFVPTPGEVAAVLEVPIATLVDPETLRVGRRTRGGIEIDAPYFAVGDHQVWGATAMILGELLAVLEWQFLQSLRE
jgi:8-oxo-dGTP pyrophosphatase MutT (NUDIX family)